MTTAAGLDHLVLATPDLEATVAALAAGLGVRPSLGGSHPGVGTRNAVLALSSSSYLEIIGPDPAQPDHQGGRPFGIDDLAAARLVTWASAVDDIDRRVTAAGAAGYDPGAVLAMSRRRPDGVTLRWRLSLRPDGAGDGLVPFLIDWGDSEHPAATASAGAVLVDLRGEHPDPDAIAGMLAALSLSLPVVSAPTPSLIAVVEGPTGTMTLR